MKRANVELIYEPLPQVQATDERDEREAEPALGALHELRVEEAATIGSRWLYISVDGPRSASRTPLANRTDAATWTWDWRRHQPNGERLHEDYVAGLMARARNSDVKAKRELAENGYGWLG